MIILLYSCYIAEATLNSCIDFQMKGFRCRKEGVLRKYICKKISTENDSCLLAEQKASI